MHEQQVCGRRALAAAPAHCQLTSTGGAPDALMEVTLRRRKSHFRSGYCRNQGFRGRGGVGWGFEGCARESVQWQGGCPLLARAGLEQVLAPTAESSAQPASQSCAGARAQPWSSAVRPVGSCRTSRQHVGGSYQGQAPGAPHQEGRHKGARGAVHMDRHVPAVLLVELCTAGAGTQHIINRNA